ncbi:MAG TPA: FlgD immunoglobulin-like domain containing protein [Candidatus Krumholzibacteria bacterium]|nr:FlgD immunoglobulin-like domain containing protein [Candidatus Krumholzibacteria bacterium]HPD73005.1 FlgD immunoglobulin-like domain containing protein [Candidatus Krumholzibacteria bacterium]HRY41804.1 FlgD immunoglobulin-like domain containing protein [Candidatus Krumholzibacteria bacterium]
MRTGKTPWLALCLWAVASSTLASGPVTEYVLGGGVLARVDSDGAVTVGVAPAGAWITVLGCTWGVEGSRDDAEPIPPFTAQAREGDRGGRRGFSRDADDDGDGQTDEDALDGADNDGDDLVDEDFAAISHDMTVWHRAAGETVQRLETYHWTYRHLTGLVVASYRQLGGADVEPLSLALAEPAAWIHVGEVCPRAAARASGPMFVASVADPRDGERTLWLGIALLDGRPRERTGERVRHEKDRLRVPPLDGSQVLVLAAGPTRIQVVSDLGEAAHLRDGAVDPVSGRRVSWLPPAIPATVLAGDLPVASLRNEPAGGFSLVFTVGRQQSADFDPDLFRCDDRPLGPASGLAWIGEDGQTSRLTWPADASTGTDACHPYRTLGATGAGTLEIRFATAAAFEGETLEAFYCDGRRALLALSVVAPSDADPDGATPAGAQAAADLDRRLQLSPQLLSNVPNPFRSSTRVTFQVPATAAEAFVLEDGSAAEIDSRMPSPFAGGTHAVSVTVYGLEGREIATLFAGFASVGTYEAQWDGKDEQGRTMASGAYFCKLQIDNWSVTKRLIFIR